MVVIKIRCGCGQRYAFDVEPYGGRMPCPVICPVCGEDGTAAANEFLEQMFVLEPEPRTTCNASLSGPPCSVRQLIPADILAAAINEPKLPRSEESRPGAEAGAWSWRRVLMGSLCVAALCIWITYQTGCREAAAEQLTEFFKSLRE